MSKETDLKWYDLPAAALGLLFYVVYKIFREKDLGRVRFRDVLKAYWGFITFLAALEIFSGIVVWRWYRWETRPGIIIGLVCLAPSFLYYLRLRGLFEEDQERQLEEFDSCQIDIQTKETLKSRCEDFFDGVFFVLM
jgi:hypothetical protein